MRLDDLLAISAANHERLCPRQVLGVRMGLAAGRALELDVPRRDKRLLVFVETDGCFADGISAATGCQVGRRTLRVIDYGKVAATFVDTWTGRAVRVAPGSNVRQRARAYAPEADDRWQAQLLGYQRMPDDELLTIQDVQLLFSLERFISTSGHRVECQLCGEEILNEREVVRDGVILCSACAGEAYYACPYDNPAQSIETLATLGVEGNRPPQRFPSQLSLPRVEAETSESWSRG